jgi:hypothetical protein
MQNLFPSLSFPWWRAWEAGSKEVSICSTLFSWNLCFPSSFHSQEELWERGVVCDTELTEHLVLLLREREGPRAVYVSTLGLARSDDCMLWKVAVVCLKQRLLGRMLVAMVTEKRTVQIRAPAELIIPSLLKSLSQS